MALRISVQRRFFYFALSDLSDSKSNFEVCFILKHAVFPTTNDSTKVLPQTTGTNAAEDSINLPSPMDGGMGASTWSKEFHQTEELLRELPNPLLGGMA